MRKRGLTTLAPAVAPPEVTVVKGEWPGVRVSEGGTSAGPTGVPWVDSNGWAVRLAGARRPGKTVWVDTPAPQKTVITATAYVLAIADAAMYGGRWIINPGDKPEPATWNRMMAAVRFFAAHRAWNGYRAQAVVGIESSGEELMNLTARQNQPYRIVNGNESWEGLKAILYAPSDGPGAEMRRKLLEFAGAGGLVITDGRWAEAEGAAGDPHSRYKIRKVGKGRIAVGDLSDPYQAATDAQILLSHRHDLVRFWNGGSLGSYLTAPASGKGALLQIVNYAGRPGADPVSVRVAGPYREARIQQLDDKPARPLRAIQQKGAIELHLPAIPVYAAIELI